MARARAIAHTDPPFQLDWHVLALSLKPAAETLSQTKRIGKMETVSRRGATPPMKVGQSRISRSSDQRLHDIPKSMQPAAGHSEARLNRHFKPNERNNDETGIRNQTKDDTFADGNRRAGRASEIRTLSRPGARRSQQWQSRCRRELLPARRPLFSHGCKLPRRCSGGLMTIGGGSLHSSRPILI